MGTMMDGGMDGWTDRGWMDLTLVARSRCGRHTAVVAVASHSVVVVVFAVVLMHRRRRSDGWLDGCMRMDPVMGEI